MSTNICFWIRGWNPFSPIVDRDRCVFSFLYLVDAEEVRRLRLWALEGVYRRMIVY